MNFEDLELTDFTPSSAQDLSAFSPEAVATAREALRNSDIYVYVPNEYSKPASDFPICQTYVDCVVNGCLDWGGEAAAEDFICNTSKMERYACTDYHGCTEQLPFQHTRLSLLSYMRCCPTNVWLGYRLMWIPIYASQNRWMVGILPQRRPA